MKYFTEQQEFTDVKIPHAWKKAVELEKTTELLIYNLVYQCLDNMEDVSIELDKDNKVCSVLRSWMRDEKVGFGTNAIYIKQKEDDNLVLGCIYDIYKLGDDANIMASDMFSSFDNEISEMIFDLSIEVPDEEVNKLFNGIQRKRIPINTENNK